MSDYKQRSGRGPSRLALSIIIGTLLVMSSAASVAAAGPQRSTSSGGAFTPINGDGAIRTSPDPSVVGLSRQAWDHVTVSPNGKKLVVYFWMGVQACYGLGRVDVSRHNGQVHIKLWTGIKPRPIGMVCPDLAQLYKTVIHLRRPILLGGAL